MWDAEIKNTIVAPPEQYTNLTTASAFKDNSRMEDGWILNSASELLFWVPSWNRTELCWPRNLFVIGGGVSTHLDLHNFVHGDLWQQCKN